LAGIYLHIPFCKQACNYCDFYFTVNPKRKNELIDALCVELNLRSKELQKEPIETIYLGGGTPSLLEIQDLSKIFQAIKSNYQLSDDFEYTLEANPDDLSEQKADSFLASGINRLSIGIQSFNSNHLKWMNRAHNAEQALRSVATVKNAGFRNISIDLIYGYSLLSDTDWLKELNTALELEVEHLSCYSLTVEDKTKLAWQIKKGISKHPDEEHAARQMELLMDFAERNNWDHYEISNLCKPGYRSRHNSAYWDYKPYLGIGPSAHSFTLGKRSANASNLEYYISNTLSGFITKKEEDLSLSQCYNEYVITALRRSSGIVLTSIETLFGPNYFNHLKGVLASGKLNHLLQFNNINQFSLNNKGRLLADYVMLEMMVDIK
jgi:oxygen-independent coproporphyrinogen-3 oxidase